MKRPGRPGSRRPRKRLLPRCSTWRSSTIIDLKRRVREADLGSQFAVAIKLKFRTHFGVAVRAVSVCKSCGSSDRGGVPSELHIKVRLDSKKSGSIEPVSILAGGQQQEVCEPGPTCIHSFSTALNVPSG